MWLAAARHAESEAIVDAPEIREAFDALCVGAGQVLNMKVSLYLLLTKWTF